jgi:hypothetical protein
MKREAFVARGLRIETDRDWNGRWFIAWKPDVSQMFRDPKVMLRWVAWPPKTPTGDSLRSWIASLEAADAERKSRKTEPARDELLSTGFGPECHLDEIDPNHNTRTII